MHFYLSGIQCTPVNDGVRIRSHLHKNACMYEQTTIEFGVHCTHCGQEEPKLVYTLFWSKHVI